MQAQPRSPAPRLDLPFAILLAFLAMCAIGGGASRADVQSLGIVRTFAVLAIAGLVIFAPRIDWGRIRAPLWFAAMCALVVAVQLIPLPPGLWRALPGRDFYAEAAAAAGLTAPWRPISLTPDLTLNALLSLLPPVAALIGFAAIGRQHRFALLPILIGAAMASAVLGVMQVTGGGDAMMLYRVTNDGMPVGLLANRNHQAALLALALPMLALWASLPSGNRRLDQARPWVALGAGLLLLPLMLVAGSRGGLVLALLGGLLAGALVVSSRALRSETRQRRVRWPLVAAAVAVLGGTVGATLYLSRADSVSRLGETAIDEDLRVALIAPVTEMIGEFMPVGAGFGSFDSVFRRFEPFELLNRHYFNHAHNDVLELLADAGLFGAALLILFAIWWCRRSVALWRRTARGSVTALYGRLGSAMTLMLLVASLIDYPLRTPLLAVVFAIACAWMTARPDQAPEDGTEQ